MNDEFIWWIAIAASCLLVLAGVVIEIIRNKRQLEYIENLEKTNDVIKGKLTERIKALEDKVEEYDEFNNSMFKSQDKFNDLLIKTLEG